MPMIMGQDCPCCRKWIATGDMHHCQDCWEKHHNGIWDKDWLNREEWEKMQRGKEDLEIVRQFRPLVAETWKRMHEDENQLRKVVGKRKRRLNDQMERPQEEREKTSV